MNAVGEFRELVARPGWFDDAACRGMPVNLFFPQKSVTGAANLREAKRVCADCVVRLECLAYGIDEHHGVFGGRTERDRRVMRRVRRDLRVC